MKPLNAAASGTYKIDDAIEIHRLGEQYSVRHGENEQDRAQIEPAEVGKRRAGTDADKAPTRSKKRSAAEQPRIDICRRRRRGVADWRHSLQRRLCGVQGKPAQAIRGRAGAAIYAVAIAGRRRSDD